MLNLGLRLRQGKHAYFPLDTIQDAQFATSLDKLYTGVNKTIRVTRDLDLAEKDIGFVGSRIDEQALLNFAGDSSLYINTRYDQSGNGNHATQATLENMPRIVNEGVIEREPLTGKIMPFFDGVDDFIEIADAVGLDGFTEGFTVITKSKTLDIEKRQNIAAKYQTEGNQRAWHVDYGAAQSNRFTLYFSPDGTEFSRLLILAPDVSLPVIFGATWESNVSFKAYVEGQLLRTNQTNYIQMASSNEPVLIGKASHDLGREYHGYIDDIIIFNRALTESEIERLSNRL